MHRFLLRLAAVLVWASAVQCAQHEASTPSLGPRTGAEDVAASDQQDSTEAVVFLALDGVRWQEVFLGVERERAEQDHWADHEIVGPEQLMPNLHRLVRDRGTAIGAPFSGAPFVATGPSYLSLPGYMEMLSGHAPSRCGDNECPATQSSTLVDEVRALGGSGAEDVAVISSWERIERAAASTPSKIVLSTGRFHGETRDRLRFDPTASELLDRGEQADPWPGQEDFRPDDLTAAIALHYLAVRRPRFLFLGLGETDEFAHRKDYRGYVDALRRADTVIGEIVAILDAMGARGRRTSLFVTADHGRSRDFHAHGHGAPESGRVWLVAAGGAVARRGIAFTRETYRLADIAPSIRTLMGLPPDQAEGAGRPIEELVRSTN